MQVRIFASCDVLVSVHGSHNANAMWMRRGGGFLEINPFRFYYASYQALAAVTGLHYMPSRQNTIAMALLPRRERAKATAFAAARATWSDDQCQADGRCRKAARSFPTVVNLTSFATEFAAGTLKALTSLRVRPAGSCPGPAPLPRARQARARRARKGDAH